MSTVILAENQAGISLRKCFKTKHQKDGYFGSKTHYLQMKRLSPLVLGI